MAAMVVKRKLFPSFSSWGSKGHGSTSKTESHCLKNNDSRSMEPINICEQDLATPQSLSQQQTLQPQRINDDKNISSQMMTKDATASVPRHSESTLIDRPSSHHRRLGHWRNASDPIIKSPRPTRTQRSPCISNFSGNNLPSFAHTHTLHHTLSDEIQPSSKLHMIYRSSSDGLIRHSSYDLTSIEERDDDHKIDDCEQMYPSPLSMNDGRILAKHINPIAHNQRRGSAPDIMSRQSLNYHSSSSSPLSQPLSMSSPLSTGCRSSLSKSNTITSNSPLSQLLTSSSAENMMRAAVSAPESQNNLFGPEDAECVEGKLIRRIPSESGTECTREPSSGHHEHHHGPNSSLGAGHRKSGANSSGHSWAKSTSLDRKIWRRHSESSMFNRRLELLRQESMTNSIEELVTLEESQHQQQQQQQQ